MSEHPAEVRVDRTEGLARVVLSRPPLNILTTSMMNDLAAALEDVAQDERVRLVAVASEGKFFSAGVDVADHVGEALGPMMEALRRLFEALEALPQPSVCLMHASALGGGAEVALGTDLCVASEKASLGLPEIRLGVFAPPASVLLPRLAGERRALGMLLTGESVSARDAQAMGLVNAVFEDAAFRERSEAYLGRLLALSGTALRLAKKAVRQARDLPVAEAQARLHRLYLDELMATEDAHEGLRAFMAKRSPQWKHR